MKKIMLSYLAGIAFVVGSYKDNSTDDAADDDFEMIELNLQTVYDWECRFATLCTEQRTIVTDRTLRVPLITDLTEGHLDASSFVNSPVDFSTEMVIAVVDEQRSVAAHNLTITSVLETATELIVTLDDPMNNPTHSGGITPVHIVKVPKHNKSVRFVGP